MSAFFHGLVRFDKIREINDRNRVPSITPSPVARLALFLLKVYLSAMFLLLGVKFLRILTGGGI